MRDFVVQILKNVVNAQSQTVVKCPTRTMGQVKYRVLYQAELRVKHTRTEAVLPAKKRLVAVLSSTLDPKRHPVMTAVTGFE